MSDKQKFNFKHNNIIKHVSDWQSGGFNRPNHDDFRTTEELKKAQFTGVRQNEISRNWEFWILGEIKKAIHESEAYPEVLAAAHLELFQLRTK